jgi:hypothetical protein
MGSTKNAVLEIITQLPEAATLEDVQYLLYVRQKVEHGLSDMRKKKVVAQRTVEQRLKKWQGK